MKLTRRFIQLADWSRESNLISRADFSASEMAMKDAARLQTWLSKNAAALAEELKVLIPAASADCPHCDGNGCTECQPEVWFVCQNHPEHRVQSNGWIPCPRCGAELSMVSEPDVASDAHRGTA